MIERQASAARPGCRARAPWRPAALVGALAAACTPAVKHDEPPAVIEAVFDPAAEPAPEIPKPTDLAYDADEGRISIDLEDDDSDAQTDLVTFLTSLDGWPASMPAEAEFAGVLDPASVTAETVRVFDVTDLADPRPIDVGRKIEVEAGATTLLVHPGLLPTWQVGRRYAVAVLGGEAGVRGAGGEEVVPSPVFWFFRLDRPVAVCRDDLALTGCRSLTALIDDTDVADLEEIRRENAEVFDALETAGVTRSRLALGWSFRTSTRTVVPFDPSVDDVHFPNDYYLSEDETHLELPAPEGSTPESGAFLARLNALDGYSVTAPGRMRFVGPFDGRPANLTNTSLLFLDADDEQDLPLVQRAWDAERNETILAPYRALRPGTRYAAVATDYLTDVDERKIIPSHVWMILRSHHPAADADGRSLLDGVSDEDARDLEEARIEYEELFDTLANRLAYPREKIQVGAVFTTRSLVEAMQALRERPAEAGLATAVDAPTGVQEPAAVVPAGLPHGNLAGVVEGTVPGLDLLDPSTRELAGAGRAVALPFVMTLPASPPAGRAAAPLVLFQHDLDGDRRDAFAVADALAAEGWATFAIDLPGHGGRGVCLDDGDCDGGSCVAGACSGGSLRRDGDGRPLDARDVLVPVARPFAAGDAFRQHAVDLVAVVRSLRAADGPAALAGVTVDPTDISFWGVGLGASAGTIFLAVDPAVHVAVMTAPAGNLGDLVARSTAFTGAIEDWLSGDLGLAPDVEARRFFRYGWSWAADPGDGAVYTRHLTESPLPDPGGGGPMAPRAMLVQVAPGDTVVPLECQRFYYLSGGVDIYPQEFAAAAHGFLLDPDDPSGASARAQGVAFIASGGATVLPGGGK